MENLPYLRHDESERPTIANTAAMTGFDIVFPLDPSRIVAPLNLRPSQRSMQGARYITGVLACRR